jgi:hypothetical protein
MGGGTATAGSDYTSTDVPFTVVTNGNICWVIPTMDDSIIEGNETFSITLTLDEDVTGVQILSPNPVTVTIIDDDGNYINFR